MGYSHYYTQTRSLTVDEWAELSTDIAAILSYVAHGVDIPLANAMGDPGTHPEIGDSRIMFNGMGENAYETFSLVRKRVREWEGGVLGGSSCKTARKPYDLAVAACLCYVTSITDAYEASSDGHAYDFTAGLRAAREALPNKANQLDYPMGVMRADRWMPPWVKTETKSYQVLFCVDGRAFVESVKTGEWYQFETHQALAQFLHATRKATFRRGGNTVFGGYGTEEPDIWDAWGSFDVARHERLARAQAKVLSKLFPADVQHAVKPMAYIRPDDLQRYQESNESCYSLGDLLKRVETVTS